MRFLQVHLSIPHGGAHVAIDNLRIGLERIGHRCIVETSEPEKAILNGNHDLVLLHSFSEENRDRYVRCLKAVDAIGAPHAIVHHDYWAMCHQTNLIQPSMGWKRCRVTVMERCNPGRCRFPVRHPLLFERVRHRDAVCFTDRGSRIFEDAGFSKVTTIPHGIDLPSFEFQPRCRDRTIRACFTNAWGRRELKGYPHWDWIKNRMAGGEVEFIEVLGKADHASMPGFLSACDVMLFLSIWEETFGLVVIESMACGTPVIGYRSGVAPDAISNGRSGFLLDSSNPSSAIDALSKMIDMSADERERMRSEARSAVEGFYSVERMAGDYVDLAKKIGSRR